MRPTHLVTTTRRFARLSAWPVALVAIFALSAAPAAEADDRENPPARAKSPSERVHDRTPSTRPSPAPPPAPSVSPAPSSPTRNDGGGSDRGYHRGYPGHRYGFGFGYGYGYRHYGYGLYWPYYRFYSDYRHPYYPWGWAWYPTRVDDPRIGAIDLDIKPSKADVYVDGEYVGRARKFDGFPGFLWLSEGSHQLVFHYEGKETIARNVRVGYGPVRRLKLTLADGKTVAPEALFRPVEEPRTAERTSVPRVDPIDRRSESRTATLDLRGEPGRFRVDVEPSDASVYLDGRFLGSAEELERLHSGMMVDAGEHYIEVQRPGFETQRIEFTVAAGDETELKIDLESSEDSTE